MLPNRGNRPNRGDHREVRRHRAPCGSGNRSAAAPADTNRPEFYIPKIGGFLHRVFVQGAEESIDERRFGAVDHVLPIKVDHHFGELPNLAELFERNHLKHVDPIVLVEKVKRIGANVNDDGARRRFSDQIEQNGE